MQIAPMLNGRIDIKYRRVDCTPPVPVKVLIDGNSGPGGWLRLSVTVSRVGWIEFGLRFTQSAVCAFRHC